MSGPAVDVSFDRPQLLSPREELVRFTEDLLAYCLEDLGFSQGEVSVRYTSKAGMRRLNRDFLGEDRPTDVLSFPAEEPRGIRRPVKKRVYLGDLAICLPVCAAQAPSYQRTAGEEVALMLVHGLLHLLGHDHDSKKREELM